MNHLRRHLLALLALSLPWVAVAQQDLGSALAVTIERLLHEKPAGPYMITIWGERFIDRSHLDLVITEGGAPIGPGADVRVVLERRQSGALASEGNDHQVEGAPGGDAALAAGTKLELRATFDETSGRYRTGTFTLPSAGNYSLLIEVQGEAGHATAQMVLRFFPQKPDASFDFLALNVLTPVIALALLLAFYRWRGIALEAPPRGRTPTCGKAGEQPCP